MAEILSHLLSLGIGLFIGGIGKILFERYKFLQNRLVTANAICAEIEAKEKRLIANDLAKQLRLHAEYNRVLIVKGEEQEEIYDLTKKDIGYLPKELAGRYC